MYYRGAGVKQDYAEAVRWYRKAAEQGNLWGQNALGSMYQLGMGVKQDYAEAVKWFRKSAKQGNASAQNLLGKAYALGTGVKKNYTEAVKWYRKAAMQDYADAEYKLSVMYSKGQGVKRDLGAAARWRQMAAEQGHAEAQALLGAMYYFGKNYVEAGMWFLKAAAQGNSKAQTALGTMFYDGKGVKQDYAEAARWLIKGSEIGNAEAQLLLGKMYYYGKGVKQNYAEAAKWYFKAAAQRNTKSQLFLGTMYYEGKGVKQDYAEAAKWSRKAAEQGYADAQSLLGTMYADGRGVIQSGAAAADWYYKAGLSYLTEGNREWALKSVESIKKLQTALHLNVPNAFLADKLMEKIYSGNAQSNRPQNKKANISLGTGWPVEGGFVVTNHHVISGHKHITLILKNGMKISGTVVIDDSTNDLVLIRVKDTRMLPPGLPLITQPIHAGARVFTIGYPHPDLMGSEPKITDGIISSLTGIGNDPRTYQISVPVQSGNSGGPLLNMHGEVAGIVTSKLSASKVFEWTGDLPQNVNYAVKSGYLSMLLSSVSSNDTIPVLSAHDGNIEQLAARIEASILLVVAE